MTVLIVDYGMGNIASARRSLEECGAKVVVSDDPAALRAAERVVIPGVGAFPKAMEKLHSAGWPEAIRSAAYDDGLPVLGICLGMQLLAEHGTEFESTQGLGLIPGKIERIVPVETGERVPHVGWNEVNPHTEHPLFAGLPVNADFYFVHSFRFVCEDSKYMIASTPFAGRTVAVVGNGHVVGTQFHPEKSSRVGFQMLRNFLALKSVA
jgi:imidazole glycerol-phosphate synthase subunit HisH